jgi:hypothetical protein
MIERENKKLSVRRQCTLLAVNRNRLEPRAPKRTASDLELIKFPRIGGHGVCSLRKDIRHAKDPQSV